ncbi:hypothetical protein Tco_0617258, partial [Tanacetum coccineum]
FTSEYGIPEGLHPELPGPEDTVIDFPEGKVGVYTKFFEFANYRIPISQFLFDILGHYQIHLSQLSVIGAAKVSNFEINCRVQNIIPTLKLFCVFYIPSFNSGWMSFSKRPGKNTLQCYTKPIDSLKNWNNHFFWVDERIFPTVVDWRTSAPKGWDAIRWFLFRIGHSSVEYKPNGFVQPDPQPEPVQGMEDTNVASGSSGKPSTIEKSSLDFDNENLTLSATEGVEAGDQAQDGLAHEVPSVETATTTESTRGGKSLAAMGLEAVSTFILVAQETSASAKNVSDPNPLSSSKRMATEILPQYVATTEVNVQLSVGSPDSGKSTSVPSVDGSPGGIYQPAWDVTNNFRLDTPEACQDMVDHTVPPGYFSELRHLPNT